MFPRQLRCFVWCNLDRNITGTAAHPAVGFLAVKNRELQRTSAGDTAETGCREVFVVLELKPVDKTLLVALIVDSFKEFRPVDPGEFVRPKALAKCLQVPGKLPFTKELVFAFELGSPR